MPTYEYHCQRCGRVYEAAMSFSEHQKRPRPPCPKCGARKVRQVPSSFQAVTAKKT